MKIVVLAGGLSVERDVSMVTGAMVADSLKSKGHSVVLIDAFLGYKSGGNLEDAFDGAGDYSSQRNGIQTHLPDLERIKRAREDGGASYLGENVIELCRLADIVFLALHGDIGENGKLQAAFDIFGIKYTGTGSLGSALAMDKGITKQLFIADGIPTPQSRTFHISQKNVYEGVSYPCVVKPCSGGSSIGTSVVKDKSEYERAVRLAFKYEDRALVEDYVNGREFSIGILAGKCLPIIEICPKEGFYDYENKYQQGRTEEICPAKLDDSIIKEMQVIALRVSKTLRLEVYARIDFMLDANNNIYCIEANTLPGMTPLSLLPQEALAIGLSHADLCEQIIALSLLRYGENGNAAAESAGEPVYSLNDKKGLPL